MSEALDLLSTVLSDELSVSMQRRASIESKSFSLLTFELAAMTIFFGFSDRWKLVQSWYHGASAVAISIALLLWLGSLFVTLLVVLPSKFMMLRSIDLDRALQQVRENQLSRSALLLQVASARVTALESERRIVRRKGRLLLVASLAAVLTAVSLGAAYILMLH